MKNPNLADFHVLECFTTETREVISSNSPSLSSVSFYID